MSLCVGRYETVRALASGGMGTVYLGRAMGVGGFERLVAIKIMHRHLAAHPDFVNMFLDEARLAARIRHPNVVATIDVQQEDGRLFLVMEYIEGLSLQRLLKAYRESGAVMPLPMLLRIFIDMLTGLHAAHELKGADGAPLQLVHRDVSPDNVLVGSDGIARITDFGVARARARITTSAKGEVKGKIQYMCPEQLSGDPIDRSADIYAAGVVLWEALVGSRLFVADHEAEMLFKVVGGAQERPRDRRPDVPEALDEVCMKALEFEPADRFSTAADFADALDDAAYRSGIRVASTRALAAMIGQRLPLEDTISYISTHNLKGVDSGPTDINLPAFEHGEAGHAAPATDPHGPGPSHRAAAGADVEEAPPCANVATNPSSAAGNRDIPPTIVGMPASSAAPSTSVSMTSAVPESKTSTSHWIVLGAAALIAGGALYFVQDRSVSPSANTRAEASNMAASAEAREEREGEPGPLPDASASASARAEASDAAGGGSGPSPTQTALPARPPGQPRATAPVARPARALPTPKPRPTAYRPDGL